MFFLPWAQAEEPGCEGAESAKHGLYLMTPDGVEHVVFSGSEELPVFRKTSGTLTPHGGEDPSDIDAGYDPSWAPTFIDFQTDWTPESLVHMRLRYCHVHGGPEQDRYQVSFKARFWAAG